MLKNHLRRDLQWLKRQARKDRRITAVVLAGVAGVWGRQFLPPTFPWARPCSWPSR